MALFHPDRTLNEAFVKIGVKLDAIIANQERLLAMSATDSADIANLGSVVATLQTGMNEVLAKLSSIPTGGLDPADKASLESSIATLGSMAATMTAAGAPPAAAA